MILLPSSTLRLQSCLFLVVCACLLCLPGAHSSAAPIIDKGGAGGADFNTLSPTPGTASWQEPTEGTLYDFLKNLEPTADTKNLEQVRLLVEKGEYGQAQQQVEIFIKGNPKYGPGYEILGLVLLLQNQSEKAVAAFEKAAGLEPKSSSALTKLSGVYMAQGQHDKAKQVLQKAVTINPQDRFANQRLGMLAEEAKEFDKAIGYYERGIQGTPSDYVGVKVNLAALYNLQRQFSKTIGLLGPVLKPDNKNVTGHIVLGTAYLYSEQVEKAIEQFQYASALDRRKGTVPLAIAQRAAGKIDISKQLLLEAETANPNDPLILFQLAETCNRQASGQEAQRYYSRAIEAGYPAAPALRQIASLQMKLGQYSEAIGTLQKLVASKDSVLQDQFVLAEAFQFSGQFAEAEIFLRSLSERNPKEPLVWHRLGLHYGLVKNYAKAIENLKKAKALDPKNPVVLKALSLAYYQNDNKNEALLQAQELCRLYPEDKEQAFFLASLHQGAGKLAEAKSGYTALLANNPNHAPSLNNLADLTAQAGDLAEALNLARKAVELEPDNSRYLDTLGWILFQVADYAASLATLEKAYKISPKVPIIQFHLGKVYLQKGEKEKAKQLLQSSVSEPSAPWAAEVNSLLRSID